MKKTESEISTLDVIKQITQDLFSKLAVAGEIEVSEKEADHFSVNLKTEETGLIIGHHGEILNSLQLILGVIIYKKIGKWIHIVLDVGDYRKTREESIKEMVTRIIQEVEASSKPVVLPFLTPLERRIVHMMLADNSTVSSQSEGEGKDRRVIIKPRK